MNIFAHLNFFYNQCSAQFSQPQRLHVLYLLQMMTAKAQISSNGSKTPMTHVAGLLNYAEKNITSFYTDSNLVTSNTSFPIHMCVIMSQCPLLATLIRSVSHVVMDSPTILLPQFSTSSVKSLLALLYTGKCALSQDRRSEFEEIKQIMKAIGLNVGTDELEIVFEKVFSDMGVTASSNNNTSGTNGNIKIEIDIKIEPKQDPAENDDLLEETGVEVVDDISTGNHEEGKAGGQIPSELPDVAFQSQSGVGMVGRIDKALLKIDIDEDSWQKVTDHNSNSEDIEINSFPGALGEEETVGRNEKRIKDCSVEVRRSNRDRKPVRIRCVGKKEIEVKPKEKFSRSVVKINMHGIICGFCKTGLSGKKELQQHLGVGFDNKYRCKVKQDMEMVKLAQSGLTNHVCNVCGKGFKYKSNLTRHGVVHTKERLFVCDQCNKSYTDGQVLARHKKSFHEGVKYECQECGEQFSEKSVRTRHYRRVHLKEKMYKCPKCGVQFFLNYGLIHHMMNVHSL